MTPVTITKEVGQTAQGTFLLALFVALSAGGHRYAVLRGYEGLPDSPGRDVDILVDSRWSRRQLVQLVRSVSAETHYTLLRYRHTDNFTKFKLHNRTSGWLEIDLWTEISWRGLQTANSTVILDNRQTLPDSNIDIVSPASEAAISFLKEYLPFGQPKDKYKQHIQSTAVTASDNIKAVWQGVLPNATLDTLLEQMQAADWSSLADSVNNNRKQLIKHQLKQHPLRQLGRFARYAARFSSSWVKPSGLMLCLIGPDGSGKTTTSNALIERLQPGFSNVYYGHGHFGILPRLGGKKAIERSAKPITSPQSPKPLPLSRALLHVAYYFFDYLLGHLTVRSRSGRGQLLIFDRYFYDYLIQQSHRRVPRRLLHGLMRLIPQPDLIVWLRNEADVIHARKPELTVAALQEQLDSCAAIVSRTSNAITVDTNQPLEQVVDAIEMHIFSHLEREFS